MSYNGWSNYETWAVAMYLDGNYDGSGTYLYVLDLARDTESVYDLAGTLREFVNDTLPDLGASLEADLLGAALDEVNWRELAEAKLVEVEPS